LQQAETCFREVLEAQPAHEEALRSLVVICLQSQRPGEAVGFVESLVQFYPGEPLYQDRLATIHESRGDREAALDVYRRLLEAHPQRGDSRFNYARLLRQAARLQDALTQYRECLRLGISQPEEVHTQIGVVLGDLNRIEEAEQSLREALRVRQGYLPALYNLGLLQEERGDWVAAKITFSGILDSDAGHVDAMARLAHGETHSTSISTLVRKMNRALKREDMPTGDIESLHYALGKVFDDCRQYQEAFAHFDEANRCSRSRCQPYDPAAQSAQTRQLIDRCDSEWLGSIAPVSDAPLIFICGMFRSGSTLLEQILGAHPLLVAGGEINYFPRAIGRVPGNYPDNIVTGEIDLGSLGADYLAELERLFGDQSRVIDKRPDNFLYLGLIKGLFPNVRILHTVRDPLDAGLSLYGQSLAENLGYANRLGDIGHYWREYRRLMDHWQGLLGGCIQDVSYETLVQDLQGTATSALNFLDLDWHEDCANFHRGATRVRTASVSQVRRELYTGSIGRWKHYEQQLEPLRLAIEAN
jgi:tetratricopeptide (TPR) repeat protein